MKLTEKQQEQEDDYKYGPYHWFKYRETFDGRLYFGYLDICLDFLKEKKLSEIKVLDAGCGDGRFTGEAVAAGVKNMYGVDYSQKAISFAKLIVTDANFQVADLIEAPFDDGFFDVIFFIETLEHIIPEKIDILLKGLSRILKKDGELIVTVPSMHNGKPSPESKHYQHFTPESLEKTLNTHFEIVEILGQDNVRFHPLKIVYKLLDNKYWDIKVLRRFYNTKIWPKYFNECEPKYGHRLIAKCRKKI